MGGLPASAAPFIERIERLEEEKRTLAADIKEVYAEAKGTGFDTKIMRQIIRLRRMDKDDLDEQESLLDVYKTAPRHAARNGDGGVSRRLRSAPGDGGALLLCQHRRSAPASRPAPAPIC